MTPPPPAPVLSVYPGGAGTAVVARRAAMPRRPAVLPPPRSAAAAARSIGTPFCRCCCLPVVLPRVPAPLLGGGVLLLCGRSRAGLTEPCPRGSQTPAASERPRAGSVAVVGCRPAGWTAIGRRVCEGGGAEYRDGERGGEGQRAEKRGNEERKEEEKEEKQGNEGREEERKMKSERRGARGGGGGGGIRQGREGGGKGQWLTNRRMVCGPRGAARGGGPCFPRQPPSDSTSGLKLTSMEVAILLQRHTLDVPLRGQPCPFCCTLQEGPASGSQVMPRPARREARER